MTEPDWKDVTPQPLGYANRIRIGHMQRDTQTAIAIAPTPDDHFTVPVYLAPMPQQPGQPQEYMRGYSDAKAWAIEIVRKEHEEWSPIGSTGRALESVLRTLRQNEAPR